MMAASHPVITLENVCFDYRIRKGFFRFGRNVVLRDIDFNVYRGETLGIIGRNGCGKSTLLRLIAGVFTPNSGRIDRRGSRVSLLSLAAGFDPQLTGRDNIILSAMLLGAEKREAQVNMEEIVDFSELESYIDQPVGFYSSGMRMRLGFSIAITIKPDVLLIDEALGVGDAAFKIKAEKAIVEKIQSDQTVILVSHSHSQVAQLCSRVIWLEHGSIRLEGDTASTLDLYRQSLNAAGSV